MGHANAQESPTFASTGSGADPFAIMKEMGHTNIKTTMIYVSLGKSHIRGQVEKLNAIPLLPPPA
jgi:site-specific recombinase XerD